jgi:hypothetical protein
MKKITSIFILSLFTATCVFAQTEMKNAIKVTPITFVKGQLIMVHYERAVFKNMTVAIGAAPVITGPLIGSLAFPVDKFKNGFAIDPEIRWYAKSDKVMDGFFFGLYNSNRFSSWESSADYGSIFLLDPTYTGSENAKLNVSARKTIVGIQLGTHRLIGKHFSVDFYSGVGFSGSKTTAKYADTKEVFDEVSAGGVNLRLNVALGWRF